MGKVHELPIPTSEGPNDFTEIWLSNLFLDHLVNHWPESWRLPINILVSCKFML